MPRVNVSAGSAEHSLNGERLALLAIFARSEDELFGPAGTLARYANEGIDVSLVAAARTPLLDVPNETAHKRDRTCACRASGIRRACLFDYSPDELARVAPATIEERVVRLIRELRPQVIITFAPEGLRGDAANRLVSGAATAAFHHASDAQQFPQHLNEGLGVHAAQKLYYCVLPRSVVAQWGLGGLNAVPDEQITTTLDVSAQSEMMKNALYCQRYRAPDFIRRLDEQHIEWKTEYYILVESRLRRRARREKDLFAGLR
jgi:N-acetyl-1-D-myo-inositol-2-amino-2-deoxy-alpha-D-glucopyranoside deacetylase